MVDRKLQKKWLAALVSRKYKQGRLKLRPTEDTFCCFGVLCNLVDKSKWCNGNWGGRTDMPLAYVLDMVGLSEEEANDFAALNDDGKKFYQIARRLRTKFGLAAPKSAITKKK